LYWHTPRGQGKRGLYHGALAQREAGALSNLPQELDVLSGTNVNDGMSRESHTESCVDWAVTRRALLQSSAVAAALSAGVVPRPVAGEGGPGTAPGTRIAASQLPDLQPARWIWYPSGRCLQNTFVLFRRELVVTGRVIQARGWISADSRYLLWVNGKRIQWGPAPCDPRFLEADPIDLSGHLEQGTNVLGAQVLFYGQGDGTCPAGKPGFLFWLEVETSDGAVHRVGSDGSWLSCLARAWRSGQYKRSFVRALQEEFDARKHLEDWSAPSSPPDEDWLAAMVLDNPPDKPPISSHYENYQFGFHAEREDCELRPRLIPLLREHVMPVSGLTESHWLRWRRPPEEYFECLTPNSHERESGLVAAEVGPLTWQVKLDGVRAAVLTFELPEQAVGWPFFSIDATAGTIVELLVHEAHEPGGPALANTHWNSWARFTCREGKNTFETFDYESCRWIQLHIHGSAGTIRVSDVGLRRRVFPWPHAPVVQTNEPKLQRLMAACINTLHNCAQDVCVDGMARERQQYSGECAHQLHAIYLAFGETRLPERFITTFSQGLTSEGYFLDCWPGYDRMARLMSRPMQLAGWGPILDHGIGFVFDCYHHYLYTGHTYPFREVLPRLKRFVAYLGSLNRTDGLLPVSDIGVPIVWMDHQAYRAQNHKQCAFNLYAAGMLKHAFAPLCRAFGDEKKAQDAERFSDSVHQACVRRFWSKSDGVFVDNLPWIHAESAPRWSDRTLAMSVLFGECPENRVDASIDALASVPQHMGLSYPANACWRLWALAAGGRTDVAIKEFREKWAVMDSVRLNNTIQEDWFVRPDSLQQWSHCGVVPLYYMYMSIAGIRPLEPGFARFEIRPQPADLEEVELVAHTVKGPIRFAAKGNRSDRRIMIETPAGCEGELVVDDAEQLELVRIQGGTSLKQARYVLPAGRPVQLKLEHT
jgi:alpha-L-rhamnosidase